MKDKERKKEVESLLSTLADERFALLVNLGKKITDWGSEEKMQTGEVFKKIVFHFPFIHYFLNYPGMLEEALKKFVWIVEYLNYGKRMRAKVLF